MTDIPHWVIEEQRKLAEFDKTWATLSDAQKARLEAPVKTENWIEKTQFPLGQRLF